MVVWFDLLNTLPKLFLSFGAMCLMIDSGKSLSGAKHYQMELAEYRLTVGSALYDVQKVSDTLEKSADSSTIAPHQKKEIKKLTQESSAVLERVAEEIEGENEKLIYLEQE